MYDYPLSPFWDTQDIIDVMALYNAVEKAYEEGISKDDFMKCYRQYIKVVDSKSEQKQIDVAFEKVSHYSIYQVFQKAKDHDWIDMR
ncbi:UPF0223 family protein [Massilimicrobiota timonensis]|uniref:UPF0223 family protein n=1 Tax=Massilimicrobiota timonensis TaxID=1776392 RepID=UPI0036F44D5A